MNKRIKRRLRRCGIFLAVLIVTVPIFGIAGSIIRAETTAVKIDANADYFGGSTGMRSVEVAQASSNAVTGIADFIFTALTGLWIFLFAYNGGIAVYEYIKWKEKEHEKG
jgi:hypothetical protein